VARIKLGEQESLYLGNLDAKRDWGYAGDYVKAMWLMLQQEQPEDYVIATGETHSVREFIELAFKHAGIDIIWRGTGLEEKGIDSASGKEIVHVDPHYFRPAEVDLLLGDPTKAREKLGWKSETSFEQLVSMMVTEDFKNVERDLLCKKTASGLATGASKSVANQATVEKFFCTERPEYIFLAAAKVGGIQANNNLPAEFIYDNVMIEANVIHSAHKYKVSKLLFLGSSCIYPKYAPQPIKEEYLLTGELEPTNEPYAISKILE
ncbi:MAG: GDP-mannose 4,6-dehydratase, partial [Firmicutes bacterium]|nr:GDP-mannose 4,6-dehydratase [Bacillota bacterium]